MFFENEFSGSLTFLRLLFVVLIGLAPVTMTIAIKRVLYRRRLAEDEMPSTSKSRVTPASESALEDFAIVLAKALSSLRHSERRSTVVGGMTPSRS